jgi:hypothetical protein
MSFSFRLVHLSYIRVLLNAHYFVIVNEQSLGNAMTFLTDPDSPALFRASVKCYTMLVQRTTSPQSQERFHLLSELVSTDIIGGPWIYGTRSTDVLEASVEVLGPALKQMGLGSVRFLKVC